MEHIGQEVSNRLELVHDVLQGFHCHLDYDHTRQVGLLHLFLYHLFADLYVGCV